MSSLMHTIYFQDPFAKKVAFILAVALLIVVPTV